MHKFYQLLQRLLLLLAVAAGPAPSLAQDAIRIAAFGDSLMAGYGLPSDQGFVVQLDKSLRKLGYDAEVINLAISGSTTADGLNRISEVVKARPDVVLLGLGSNDALRYLNPAAVHKNLTAIIERLTRENIPILMLGSKAPLNWGLAYKRKFDSVFEDLADEHDLVFYPFILDGVALAPSLNQADGVHPNAAGVQVMVKRLEPYLRRLLGPLDN